MEECGGLGGGGIVLGKDGNVKCNAISCRAEPIRKLKSSHK